LGRRWEALLQVMPLDPAQPFTSFLALTGITALNFIMTANGVPALYTTLAQSFSDATGFPLLSVIMIQVLGYSTPLLPYQASPIVVAMALRQSTCTGRDVVVYCTGGGNVSGAAAAGLRLV
jgi:hypothetical protein